MKKFYVDQLKERERIESVFLVREKNTAMARNGKPYLTLKMMDRTGDIEGRVWDRVDELAALFEKDDFIRVEARVNVYLGKMQLVVQEISRVAEEELDLSDFLPVSGRSQDAMREELDGLLDSLDDPHIEALLRAFFDDPEFYALYRRAPAAKGIHHVFLGGLLEHSLAVAALANDIARRYPNVNRDLLISGAMLHDVGKVHELSYRRSFDYTDEGKLLGHIVMGVQMIEDRVRRINGFPAETATLVKHLVLSHHGQYEFGSPKRPKFLEAVILNFIDDLDSKINGVQAHLDSEPQREGNWTSYHRLYDRYFYKGPASQEEALSGEEAQGAPETPPAEVQRHTRDQRTGRPARNKPLGASLGDQLKEKNLDLFTAMTRSGEDQ